MWPWLINLHALDTNRPLALSLTPGRKPKDLSGAGDTVPTFEDYALKGLLKDR
jgi:hypothetical protein